MKRHSEALPIRRDAISPISFYCSQCNDLCKQYIAAYPSDACGSELVARNAAIPQFPLSKKRADFALSEIFTTVFPRNTRAFARVASARLTRFTGEAVIF